MPTIDSESTSFSPFHDPEAVEEGRQDLANHASMQPRSAPIDELAGVSESLGSAIGSTSLMGLLGGTRYEPASEDKLASDDAELEGLGGDKLMGLGSYARPHQRDSIGPMSLTESRRLAASLPPPPSAMSPSSSTRPYDPSAYSDDDGDVTRDEDEDDDQDGPPDFTQRVPLVGSSAHPRSAQDPSARTGRRRRSPGSTNGVADSWLPQHRSTVARPTPRGRMTAHERALWRWVNVEDLDGFLQQCYLYYTGKGVWCIALGRGLNLLTAGWVIVFSTFLAGCIDYPKLWKAQRLGDAVVDRCVSHFSGATLLLVLTFAGFYAYRLIHFGLGIKQLWEMHEFFEQLLDIPENDIQTIPWHAIVTRISDLRASHPSAIASRSSARIGSREDREPRPLDAHDVANRIMREENYLIALFNKDVLDLAIPIPSTLRRWAPRLSARLGEQRALTKTLEWNLSFCLLGFLFGPTGQVRRAFLTETNRGELTEALRRRFMLMGVINAVFAPFIVLYLLMYSFFRYFEEYHKNPSSIGSRQFTQLARWKFREFNELPHHFQQRLNHAHAIADQYVNQFPKEKTALVSRFVAFLAGSFAAVLILFSLIDPDAFLHFEVTPGRTVLFYIGVTGTILAFARGMVPDENRVVDAEQLMKDIVEHTHYLPAEWSGKLHSAEVHTAFGQLFQMKIALFVQEILSVLVTPFVLWYSLPGCAGAIVDFFREFTVHVDGLGYVCSFGVFDFARHGDTRFGAPVQVRDERWKSGEGKMEKSFLTFAHANPSWVPRDQAQSLFLSRMTDASVAPHHQPHHRQSHSPHHQTSFHHQHASRAPGLSMNLHPRFVTSSAIGGRSASRPHRFASGGMGVTASALVEERPTEDGSTMSVATGQGLGTNVRQRETSHRAIPGSSPPPPHTAASSAAPNARHVASTSTFSPNSVFMETPIEEESRLDGESFVAPTQGRPFGAYSEEDGNDDVDQNNGAGKRTVGVGGAGTGLGGVIGELYHMQGKKW